ncbi:MAG: GumC family protein, partial [Bacteroidota bacterium]
MKGNTSDNTGGQFMALFRDLMKHWYLIFLSLAIAGAAAFFYLKFAAKTYNVGTTVLLKTDNPNRLTGEAGDFLEITGLISQDKNFQNELYVLTSSPLIKQVIDEMPLRVNYYLQEDKIPKQFTKSLVDIYKSSPFLVILNEEHIQPINTLFYINIIDEDNYVISAENNEATIQDLKDNKSVFQNVPFRLNGSYSFGEQVENEFCSFQVLLNSNYDPDFYSNKDLFFSINSQRSLIANFKSSLIIESSPLESTVVEMTLKTSNAAKGVEFLDILIDKYIEGNLGQKNFLSDQTIQYIDNQLSDISDSLGFTESRLQSLRSRANIMNIDEKAENIYAQIQGLELSRREAERQLGYLEQLDNYFSGDQDVDGIRTPSSMGLDDPLLNNLIQELTTLNAEKDRIVSSGQLRNPRLKSLEASIDNLKEVITENIKFSISSTRNDYENLNQKISDLNAEFSRLPGTQRQLLGIERKFNLNDAVYTSLLEQRIQAQIIKASNLPDCEIIEPPQLFGVASPNNLIIYFLAVFIGGLLPVGFILGKRLIGDRFIDANEIKNYISIPQIGSVPVNKNKYNNVVLNASKSSIAESFHIIRSNLIYYLHEKEKGTILVTSSLPEEGKSFTALNIATSFATTNNKTVLLEFDLRKPSKVFNEFGTRALVGISSYLINKATLDEIIIKTDIPNLDIVQAGKIPPNPVELISSRKTQALLDDLKQRYDYIIVDTPPYGLVSDSFILMKYADISLYVTRLTKIKKSVLVSNIESLEMKVNNNLYLMINENIYHNNSVYSEYRYLEKHEKSRMKQL